MEWLLSSSDEGGEQTFPVGSWERPDEAGIIRRGGAVGFRGYVERYGGPPPCFVGSRPGDTCRRPAVMEVYGITMCEAHGEEAASGALEELAFALEQEFGRLMNPHVRSLGAHVERALRHGFDSLPEGTSDYKRDSELQLAAFPLDRDRADTEILAYVKDPDGHGRGTHEPPYDMFMHARMLLHRHMRLAFEEDADWLVEMLEGERARVAAQAAYALALEREAGLRKTY